MPTPARSVWGVDAAEWQSTGPPAARSAGVIGKNPSAGARARSVSTLGGCGAWGSAANGSPGGVASAGTDKDEVRYLLDSETRAFGAWFAARGVGDTHGDSTSSYAMQDVSGSMLNASASESKVYGQGSAGLRAGTRVDNV
jgi:hypothetical protein